MAIPWEEKYNLGIKEIDLQHMHFVETLNKLYDAINNSQVQEELEKIIDQLIEYKNLHFSTEEKYFDLFKYEGAEEHKKEHDLFSDNILRFQEEFKSGKKEITFELTDFLEDWLINHLSTMDKKYADCFHAHNLH
jgi:hemerythrin